MEAVGVRLASVPPADFARATELMELAVDAVIAELKRAERYTIGRGLITNTRVTCVCDHSKLPVRMPRTPGREGRPVCDHSGATGVLRGEIL
jgi:hypothetical protein